MLSTVCLNLLNERLACLAMFTVQCCTRLGTKRVHATRIQVHTIKTGVCRGLWRTCLLGPFLPSTSNRREEHTLPHSTTARLLSFRRRFGGSSLFLMSTSLLNKPGFNHSGTENLSNNSDAFRLEKPLTPVSCLWSYERKKHPRSHPSSYDQNGGLPGPGVGSNVVDSTNQFFTPRGAAAAPLPANHRRRARS
jgi:hypothetical protein